MQTKLALPQSEFDASLPEVRKAIIAARKEMVLVPPVVIKDLQNKLVSTPDTAPDYWQTAADLLSYGSVITANWPQFRAQTSRNTVWSGFPTLPNCVDSPPIRSEQQVTKVPQGDVIIKKGEYRNCRFEVDSPQQQQRLSEYLHDVPVIWFYHSLIVYRGGEITLPFDTSKTVMGAVTNLGSSVRVTLNGPAIHFYECMFDFSFQDTPPAKGQELIKFVLRQDPKDMSIPMTKPSDAPLTKPS